MLSNASKLDIRGARSAGNGSNNSVENARFFAHFSCSRESSRVKCEEHPMELDCDFSLL